MNRTKILLGTVILASTVLVGCSKSTRLDRLSADVQALNARVNQLSNDVNAIRSVRPSQPVIPQRPYMK